MQNDVQKEFDRSYWSLTWVVIAGGWAAYGILGGGNVFLAIMVVLTMVLGAARGLARRRAER